MSTSAQTSEPHDSSNIKPILDVRTVPVDHVVPYWRNPRRISDEAVNSVMESIRQFGYTQPISVDKDLVIIAGHTRYSALRRLKVDHIQVIIREDLSQAQVKELRTIDNRTAEFTTWDFEKLVAEIETMDQSLVTQFFPELADVGSQDDNTIVIDMDDIADEKLPQKFEASQLAEFVCPQCFHGWEMKVKPVDINKGVLEHEEG
jgi:ParB family chromosome partitioning protein